MFDEVEVIKVDMCCLEKLLVLVVVVINGVVLGGGYEFCFVLNYWIVVDNLKFKIGLFEVMLGLLSGGGGVVCLIWFLGLEVVMLFLLEGK